jgi:hypothetical protein
MLAIILLAIEKYKNLLYRFSNNSTPKSKPKYTRDRTAALKITEVRKIYRTEISMAERSILITLGKQR